MSPNPHSNSPCFSEQVLRWFDEFGRHDLPWQNTQDPYRIWISEIMLQQTQVKTVIPFYTRFMQQFPDIVSLAKADQDQVLHYWTGLGYYARARNLHKAAQTIVDSHAGVFPQTFDDVLELSGIGRSTAGAILSFAFSQRHPILDGNVKRVLSRHFAIEGWPGKSAVSDQLWNIAETHTPQKDVAKYTQAIMDFGATLCTRSKPQCHICPLNSSCVAFSTQRVNEFPGKKPKKILPTKKTAMLLLQNNHAEFFLIQRPPTGIWGGLWSFPEIDIDNTHSVIKKSHLDFNGENVCIEKIASPFTHTFSHFHLEITPIHASLMNQTESIISEQMAVWYDPKKPLQIGLAAPIKKLLQSM